MEINCKGSYTLGTSYGNCEKCERERLELSNMIQENINLKQKVSILEAYYPNRDEDLEKTINLLNEINTIPKFIIIDLIEDEIGIITKVNMNDLQRCDEGDVQIIDFSKDNPRRIVMSKWENIESFD